jgi:thioredoxin 1
MKKLFLIVILTLTCALHAEIGKDQFAQIGSSVQQPYGKALEICKEQGFSHFIFKRISCSDEKGQTLEFKGVTNAEGGKLITETMELDLSSGAALGRQKIEFEILCFEEAPIDHLAVDVEGVFKFVELMSQQQPIEVVEGSKVREVTSLEELKAEIAKSKGPLYVDCYSTMCPPCKKLAPKYDQYSIDLASKGTFLKINLDTVPEMGAQYKIQVIPTLLVFRDHEESERKTALPEILKYFERLKN